MLSLFDLHCDTAYEMLRQTQPLDQNTLAVSLEATRAFARYVQVMALWTPPAYSDEDGWIHLQAMLSNLKNDPSVKEGNALIQTAPTDPVISPTLMLSAEDARVLCGIPERVDALYAWGVRFLTPLWRGRSSIGGAHDTNEGLTPFGRAALRRAVTRGMVLDISHASEPSAEEIFAISAEGRIPVIASHSNAYAICPVSRNLRARQLKMITEGGGLIGINLHAPFLSDRHPADADDVLRHIDHFLANGAEHALALGCDFDGGEPPMTLSSPEALLSLAERMQQYYSDAVIRAIFFENAHRFVRTHIKSEPNSQEGS